MFSFLRQIFFPYSSFRKILSNGALIIDVRTQTEYETGHLAGSKNIALDIILSKIDEIKRFNKPVITVCKSGRRSILAKHLLEIKGITVYNGGSWANFKKLIQN